MTRSPRLAEEIHQTLVGRIYNRSYKLTGIIFTIKPNYADAQGPFGTPHGSLLGGVNLAIRRDSAHLDGGGTSKSE